jgi:hypothetical protein
VHSAEKLDKNKCQHVEQGQSYQFYRSLHNVVFFFRVEIIISCGKSTEICSVGNKKGNKLLLQIRFLVKMSLTGKVEALCSP